MLPPNLRPEVVQTWVSSRRKFISLPGQLSAVINNQEGIKAVVLGCTELSMLVDTKANVLPIYDSTEIHADAGVDWILGDALGGAM